jgi:hypothetical protein
MNATPILDYLIRLCDPNGDVILTGAEVRELWALIGKAIATHADALAATKGIRE